MMYLCILAVLSSSVIGYHFSPVSSYGALRTKVISISRAGALHSTISDEMPLAVLENQPFLPAKSETINLGKSLPIHVYVDPEIRTFLNMKNSERKVRLLLPQEIENMTVKTLREYVDRKLPSLAGQPYILRYQISNQMASPMQFKGTHCTIKSESTFLSCPDRLLLEYVC